MHLKLFPRRSDFRLIPYLIGNIDGNGVTRDFTPVIIFGEPEIFNLWMHTCQFTDIYLSGVFSWGEDLSEVTEELASATVKEGLEMITDGLPLSDFPLIVVLHRREKGFDVHFALGRKHLVTGVQFPFFTKNTDDCCLFRSWRRKKNLEHGWSDPNDVWRKRISRPAQFYVKGADRKTFSQIQAEMLDLIATEVVENREELMAVLSSEGIKATTRHNCIEVQHEHQKFKFEGRAFTATANYHELLSEPRSVPRPDATDIKGKIRTLVQSIGRHGSNRNRKLKRFHEEPIFRFPQRIGIHVEGASRLIVRQTTSRTEPTKTKVPSSDISKSRDFCSDHSQCNQSGSADIGSTPKMHGAIHGSDQNSYPVNDAPADSLRSNPASSNFPQPAGSNISEHESGRRKQDPQTGSGDSEKSEAIPPERTDVRSGATRCLAEPPADIWDRRTVDSIARTIESTLTNENPDPAGTIIHIALSIESAVQHMHGAAEAMSRGVASEQKTLERLLGTPKVGGRAPSVAPHAAGIGSHHGAHKRTYSPDGSAWIRMLEFGQHFADIIQELAAVIQQVPVDTEPQEGEQMEPEHTWRLLPLPPPQGPSTTAREYEL